MFARAKGKQQRSFDSYTCTVRNSVLHILYYLSGLSRAHFADNLSRNQLFKGEKRQILDAFVKTFHMIDPINTIICPQQAIERSVASRYHGGKISGSQQYGA